MKSGYERKDHSQTRAGTICLCTAGELSTFGRFIETFGSDSDRKVRGSAKCLPFFEMGLGRDNQNTVDLSSLGLVVLGLSSVGLE